MTIRSSQIGLQLLLKVTSHFINYGIVPKEFMLSLSSTQTIKKYKSECAENRLNIDNTSCMTMFIIDETKNYNKNPSYHSIQGTYNFYDNNGDIIISNGPSDTSIDDNIATLIILNHFYSLNYNTIVTLKVLIENVSNDNNAFSYDIYTVYLDQKVNGYLIACILISFVLLVLLFFLIKQNKEVEVKHLVNSESCCFNLKRACLKCVNSFQKNFRCPTVLELFCLLNILFFYGLLIFRFTFLSKYDNNNPIAESPNYFQDIETQYEQVTVSCCFNLFFFFIIIFGLLSEYFNEFNTITSSISSNFKKIYLFVILYLLPFILISMFISYMMFGDYYITHYRELMFAFLKVLQSFFRGSLDHIDYPEADIFKTREIIFFAWVDLAKTEFKYLAEGAGVTGYILVSLLFY